jgi:regulator of replication initiation timing
MADQQLQDRAVQLNNENAALREENKRLREALEKSILACDAVFTMKARAALAALAAEKPAEPGTKETTP